MLKKLVGHLALAVAVLYAVFALAFASGWIGRAALSALPEPVNPSGPLYQATAAVVDSQTPTITTATVTTNPVTTAQFKVAHIMWTFGTVSGSYGTCTVQAKTSYDGINFRTLGSAASVTVASNTAEQWDIIQQLGTTSVTTTSPSTSAALGFGQLTEFAFACSSYGTSMPVTATVIYR